MINNIFANFKQYKFLLKQLVIRDFKVKYKRSFLGVIWSLLYPLLMMSVLAIVFSNIFKYSMPGVNYLVYLLIGLTFFQFVSETTNLAMSSVTTNAPLINKLYVPKYIFPLSKVFSTAINFFLTLIPLYLIIIFTGSAETKCAITVLHLLLPFSYIFLFLFTTGISFILSTIAVFLRDIFYIYGIIVTIWMYFTPIMYDISIISENLQPFLKLNPLYWYITFARDIILHNQVPNTLTWIICATSSILIFAIGALLFKSKQDKFIYYV